MNPEEVTKITSVKKLGNSFSLSYVGIISDKLCIDFNFIE